MKKYCLVFIGLLGLGMGAKAQFNTIVNFDSANGGNPLSSLTPGGNRLYGVTSEYYYGNGTIFGVNTDGTGFKNLFNFNGINGDMPFGSLTLIGKVLYGATEYGGANSDGNIFSIDTDGSNFRDIYDFSASTGNFPFGSLACIGSKFYGTTQEGGANNFGCVFSIDTDGNNYKTIYSFDSVHGEYPVGGLVYCSNVLYGTTTAGGSNSGGTIFSVDTNGSYFKELYDFSWYSAPCFNLVYSTGKLFGASAEGGVNGAGNIFSLDTNGNNFKDLFDFDSANGASPYNGLTLYGNTLYGTTIYGGANDSGCIFSIDTDGSSYNHLYDFNWLNGSEPIAPPVFSAGVLCGMTYWGGTSRFGTVYGLRICSNPYNEPICIATIDTATNKAEVIWGRTNSPSQSGFGSYNIYRDSTLGFELTHTQPLNALSKFVDMNSNPTGGPVSYELSTVDSCGESSLSATHTTMFLTTTASVNAFNLSWTAYVGFTPSVYRIFRGPALNAMVQIDSVPSSTLTYTDSFPPLGSFYAVEAVNPSGTCIPTASIGGHRAVGAMLSGSFSNGFNTAILGVNNIASAVSNLNIYPNPGKGEFTITLSHPIRQLADQASTTIEVYNPVGQTVFNTTLNPTAGGQGDYKIDLSYLFSRYLYIAFANQYRKHGTQGGNNG